MGAPLPSSAGTPKRIITDNSTVGYIWKASPGILTSLVCFNISSAPFYVTLFDAATDPGSGGTAVWQCGVPAAATAANGNINNIVFTDPINFATGIVVHVHTGIGDSDITAVAANVGIVAGVFL